MVLPQNFLSFLKISRHFCSQNSVNNFSITQRHVFLPAYLRQTNRNIYLKNQRPISLLITVCKIASGLNANRVKTYLDKIINPDKTGFIKGRNLAENIRTIYYIMQYTEDENIPGLRKHFMPYHVHLYKNHSNSSISVHQCKNGSDFSIQTAHLLLINVDICQKLLLCIEDAVREIHYPHIYS